MSREIKAMDVLKLGEALGVFMKLKRTRRNESEFNVCNNVYGITE